MRQAASPSSCLIPRFELPRGIALCLAAGACVEIVEAGLREFVAEFRNERSAGVEENLRRHAAPCRNPLEHRQDTSDSFRVHLPAEKTPQRQLSSSQSFLSLRETRCAYQFSIKHFSKFAGENPRRNTPL